VLWKCYESVMECYAPLYRPLVHHAHATVLFPCHFSVMECYGSVMEVLRVCHGLLQKCYEVLPRCDKNPSV
jgi:hypothetical protein